MSKSNLGILVLDNFRDFGQKVQEHLAKIRNTNENYLVSSEGVRFSNGKEYDWDYFEYLHLIDYSVYPGGQATGNLIYEVPKNQDILLEFVGVWFKVE